MIDVELPVRAPARSFLAQRQRENQEMLDTAAANLSAYFAFRANRLLSPATPSDAAFCDALLRGCRLFSGVLIDDRGAIAEDAQRPEVLRAYRQRAALDSLLG